MIDVFDAVDLAAVRQCRSWIEKAAKVALEPRSTGNNDPDVMPQLCLRDALI